jgi:Taurine catabolism dioxygenase TauD, TfdA family
VGAPYACWPHRAVLVVPLMTRVPDWIVSNLEFPDLTDAEQAASALRQALAKAELVRVKPSSFRASTLTQWQKVLSYLGVLASGEDSVSGMPDDSTWVDVRYDPALAHTFRHSATAQPLHTDSAYSDEADDLVLFLCEHQAMSGGETIFVLADTIDACAQQNDREFTASFGN